MRLQMASRIETDGTGPLFVMFHGYGNDESEMMRIIDAVYETRERTDTGDATEVGSRTGLADHPSYLSLRGIYERPYMGGNYWYPDGCGVEERRRECAAVGKAVAALLDCALFAGRRKILVGFSQGGYLSYRIVRDYPDLFDAAILLSPSFKGEEGNRLDSTTRFFLAYGSEDRTIPLADQHTARAVLSAAGHLTFHEYAGMGHAISDEEIADIRGFVRSI
ncbi:MULTISPECIES: alpha/beta hydrolase [Bifidobacterium]|uniref:alpha/beta hydrolase n=1 Tax=Bifidobacterium TaxID=1678 RepID=UPI001BDD68F9|nr:MULTISPECIES: dienelactone hydrolase family protein [Bifidobacterium]MBT1162402.1 dienelactone hydrolase family protein [Bifidobacterium sp. SO1]MBW3079627.1 dienelactone hydrolase family protein [Bifidobacterium simiiventris]